MPVDWKRVQTALRYSRNGNQLKALSGLEEALSDAHSETDRAAIIAGQANCYAHLGDTSKALVLLRTAKELASQDQAVLSQIAMSEASTYALCREFGKACELFKAARSQFHDVLSDPSMADARIELDSRFACALVDAERFENAIELFRRLFEYPELEDRQRLELFYGLALFRMGRVSEAQSLFFNAASGKDSEMANTALHYLSELGTVSQQ